MGTWSIQGNNAYIQSSSVTGDNLSVVFKPNSGNTQQGSAQNFTITYNDNGNVTTTSYTLPYCYVPAPEQHEDMFEVNFNTLPQGFEYSNTGDTHTVLVTSGTWSESTQNYVFSPVDTSFLNSDGLSFAADSRGSGGGITRSYSVHLSESPENRAVEGIEMKIQQTNNPSNYSSQTFDFRAEEAPTYEQIRIVPYIAVEQYQNPPGSDQHNRYSFQFRTVNETNPTQSVPVNTDLYFMVNDVDTLKVFANGKAIDTYDCQNSSCNNENQFIVTGSNDLKNTWKISNGGWSTYQNIDLITGIDAFASLSECCKYAYQTNGILVHFNKTKNTQNSVIGVFGLPSEANYIVEGNKQYWLDLRQQTQYIDGGQGNFYFSYIEAYDTHHIVKLTNQATFNAGQINEVSVSIYEDGAVFVDEASSDVATVGQNFNNITQFVDTVYPSGYIDIQACGLFNGVDIGEHCINDIVIEDGELIKRDESLPSSTRAMHIELDNENNN